MTNLAAETGMAARPEVDRRDREGYFFGTTNPYWHDQVRKLFEHIEAEGIAYCVLHGYEGYDGVESGDIDCIVAGADLPYRFGAAVQRAAAAEGMRLINWYNRSQDAHVYVLAKQQESTWAFFWLDVLYADFEGQWKFFEGEEMLEGRRQVNGFWAPAPGIEFAAYVTTKVTKRNLTDAHANRLSSLYAQAPEGSEHHLRRFFGPESVTLIVSAAKDNEWADLRSRLSALRSETLTMGRRRGLQKPVETASYFVAEGVRWLKRAGRRTGVHIQIAGDKGPALRMAGEVARLLAPAFRIVETRDGASGGSAVSRAKADLRSRWLMSRTSLLISVGEASGGAVPVDLAFGVSSDAGAVEGVAGVASSVIELMEARTGRRLGLC